MSQEDHEFELSLGALMTETRDQKKREKMGWGRMALGSIPSTAENQKQKRGLGE